MVYAVYQESDFQYKLFYVFHVKDDYLYFLFICMIYLCH